MPTCRDDSKKTWISKGTTDDIDSGSLQRIADAAERQAAATELMAEKYRRMEKDIAWYEKEYPARRAEITKLFRQNTALRGVITRMKKQSKEGKV